MDSRRIYEDIALRTNGDIYIGVVGPVRTGKSTFIKQFMESLVIPNIENPYQRERARDELPQSGSGRTIMTAEPKFVPEEAVEISLEGKAAFRVRLIDCVGYMIKSALGQFENDLPRMVTTPWFDTEIPMSEAAEIGTRKVIAEHSTIGLVITTDGSITEIPREDYIESEERVINELKSLKKPFLVVINSAEPTSLEAYKTKEQIENRYGVKCLLVNCLNMNAIDINDIIKAVLYEFPVREFGFVLPKWINTLPAGHSIKSGLYEKIIDAAKNVNNIRQVNDAADSLGQMDLVSSAEIKNMDLGSGSVIMQLNLAHDLFNKIVLEQSGFDISDEADIIPLLIELSKIKMEYDRMSGALDQVRQTGYGIVMPLIEELRLEEPEIVKQGGRFGVRLRASAPSIHMIRADIETEVSPIVGSEKQSEELIHYLLKEFDGEPGKIWQSNIFGKSLNELVSEGLNNKLSRMPEDARGKLQETLQRIINEGGGGLICIIL